MKNPLLPVTVQDQIRLWELERNRVKSEEGASRKIRRFTPPDVLPLHSRLSLYGICITSGLRIRPRLREAARRRFMGKYAEALLFRKFGWACEYQRIH